MAVDLRLSLVGEARVGETRVGEFTVLHDAVPVLRLRGGQYSMVVIEGAEVVMIPAKARMRLRSKTFILNVDHVLGFGTARLRLGGRAYFIKVPVGPKDVLAPMLRLVGGPFTLGVTQTLSVNRPALHLRAGQLGKVGTPGLIPSTPIEGLLTPSPAEEASVLVASVAEEGMLVATAATDWLLIPTTEEDDLLLVPTSEESL